MKPQETEPVFTAEHPKYPALLYNHKTRKAKSAANEDEKSKLAKAGFVEDPFPPENPVALTPEEISQLQSLRLKAAKALYALGTLSERSAATHPDPEHTK